MMAVVNDNNKEIIKYWIIRNISYRRGRRYHHAQLLLVFKHKKIIKNKCKSTYEVNA